MIALVSEHASPAATLGGTDAGGQNVYVACLSASLARRGHRVTVYTRRDDPCTPERRQIVASGNATYDVVQIDAGPAAAIDKDHLLPHMGEFAGALHAHLARYTPDVVHSHFWMSGTASVAAARSLGVPVVHTFHALGTVKRRHQGDADHSPACRLQAERDLLVETDRIVATCDDEVRELLDMGAHPCRIVVVPCGYDSRVFQPDGPVAQRTARPRLVAVSRMVPRKGLDDIVKALSSVPEAELVIAGGPPASRLADDPEHQQLMARAESARVADRVRCLGGTDQAAIAALDRSADVFVAVPRYEPFGIAPVEAMACGTPVVASAVGGLLDTVVHGVTGLHVPPRDPDALAAALRTLLGDSARRERLGSRASWRARKEFAWDVVARRMEDIYDEMITTPRHDRSASVEAGSGLVPAHRERWG